METPHNMKRILNLYRLDIYTVGFTIYFNQIYTDVVVLIYSTVVTQKMKLKFILYF